MRHVAVIKVEAKEAKDQAQHEPPPVLQHLTIGINEVTRNLNPRSNHPVKQSLFQKNVLSHRNIRYNQASR
jgi:hypothetical protein